MSNVFTAADKLACVEREIAWRKRVYPNRIEAGRMSKITAVREILCMQAIADDYRLAAEKERLL